ncbi:MAG: methylaspartate ammonia-lyase [Dehalobacterium sp.]|jgi:methylaspartate ammonia-lyase
MRIVDVITSAGLTGFFFDDQKAIKQGAAQDGFAYAGNPVTPGFTSIRQKGESISIMLVLEDGQIAYGDCAAVQYSGVGGRDPLFLAEEYIPLIHEEIKPKLIGREIVSFKDLAEDFDHMVTKAGHRLHTAIRYGLTQAILDATAKSRHKTMAEVVAEEYNTDLASQPIPIFCQTGDDRYTNADKSILKCVDVLPHGLINHVGTKLGNQGELLLSYVEWLKKRIVQIGHEAYRPVLHIDVYGTIGLLFNDDTAKMAAYLGKLEEVATPFKLRIEGPLDAGSKEGQLIKLKELKKELLDREIHVEIVADEWCNTLEDIKEFVDHQVCDMIQIKTPDLGGLNNIIEAVLYAKENGVGAYLGGTCNETERSSQVCVHIALATQPTQILAKPGMGVDEGLMITHNEMQRALAILQARSKK